MMQYNFRAVPIPERMKHLPLDKRGYPIPHGVMIDADGLPHFAINVEEKRLRCLTEERCSICGNKLFRGRWFVGGVLSAFHKHGAFIDPPMHSECAHYAIQVCPYLAAPQYTKEIGAKKIENKAHDYDMILVDNTMIPGRPTDDVFVVLMATGQTLIHENMNTQPKRPYSAVEFWRHGERVADAEGWKAVRRALQEHPE